MQVYVPRARRTATTGVHQSISTSSDKTDVLKKSKAASTSAKSSAISNERLKSYPDSVSVNSNTFVPTELGFNSVSKHSSGINREAVSISEAKPLVENVEETNSSSGQDVEQEVCDAGTLETRESDRNVTAGCFRTDEVTCINRDTCNEDLEVSNNHKVAISTNNEHEEQSFIVNASLTSEAADAEADKTPRTIDSEDSISLSKLEPSLDFDKSDIIGLCDSLANVSNATGSQSQVSASEASRSNVSSDETGDEDSWDALFDDSGDCLNPEQLKEVSNGFSFSFTSFSISVFKRIFSLVMVCANKSPPRTCGRIDK